MPSGLVINIFEPETATKIPLPYVTEFHDKVVDDDDGTLVVQLNPSGLVITLLVPELLATATNKPFP
jgi:hypothetical protein